MQTYQIAKIGSNRGIPRIWMEGRRIAKAGFGPGQRYEVAVKGARITLTVLANGSRVVSSRKRGDEELPIIDLNSQELLRLFEGMESVRIVMRENEIHLLPTASAMREQDRMRRLKEKLSAGEPLSIGSLTHGGGVMSLAVHTGFDAAGVPAELAFANDIRDELLSQAGEKNPAWSERTQYLATPLQELAFDLWALDRLPKVDLLEAGLACSAASVAGRARRGLSHPEEHPEVGHLVIGFLAVISRVNPPIIMLEQVLPYSSSASMSLIRTTLREWGYVLHESTVTGEEFNALEHRTRMVMVAVTRGMDFNFDRLEKPEKVKRKLGEILEDVPLDDPSWSKMEGLKAKEIRDKELGRSFAMQIFTADDDHLNTLTKGISKNRSTDCKVRHPVDPELLRMPTVLEHARAKNIPPVLIEGLCKTTAHELLGQSCIFDAFVAVGKLIAQTLKNVLTAEAAEEFQLAA
jgi:DNA (cytosine-5)-methyltransferase 1